MRAPTGIVRAMPTSTGDSRPIGSFARPAGPDTADASTERIAIVGDGQMALVLADLAVSKGHRTTVWSPFPDAAKELRATRQSVRLPGFRLADDIGVAGDEGESLAGATLLVNAIPTQFIRPTWTRVRASIGPCPIVSVAKGIETTTLTRPSEILLDTVGASDGARARAIAVLSGPSIAGELARRLPAVLVAASSDAALAERVRQAFSSPWTRVYSHDDVVGVELAGALKNIIAIAAGIIDGARLGTNAKSALLARGLAEIVRFGTALGARAETFFGIAGVGDLATTCFSPEGRNRSFGEAIARGGDATSLLSSGTSVVEGAPTAKAVKALANRMGIDMPITEAVHAVVFEGVRPGEALADLMSRSAGAERVR